MLLNFTVVLISIFVFFIGLEVALRLFFPHEIYLGEQYYDEQGKPTTFTQYDELLGWSLIPGASGRSISAEYDVSVSINSKGFRDYERTFAKAEGIERMAVLGDSFVLGEQVEQSQRFTDLLEEQMQESEVLNFGVAGYGTDQQLLLYESKVQLYEPDLIIVVLYIGNDLEDIVEYQKFTGNYKPRFVIEEDSLVLTNVPVPPKQVQDGGGLKNFFAQNSYAYNFISERLRRIEPLQNFLVSIGLRKPSPDIPFFKSLFDEEEGEVEREAWGLERAILNRFKQEVEGNGQELLVVMMPSAAQVYGGLGVSDVSIPNERMGEILDELGIDYVDLLQPMQQRAQESGERLYYARDMHLTPAGHEAVAEILLQVV